MSCTLRNIRVYAEFILSIAGTLCTMYFYMSFFSDSEYKFFGIINDEIFISIILLLELIILLVLHRSLDYFEATCDIQMKQGKTPIETAEEEKINI